MATDLGDRRRLAASGNGQEPGVHGPNGLLRQGVNLFNAAVSRVIQCTGTTLDRDLTDQEKQLLVAYATLLYLNREITKAALTAIQHRNVAGSTDLRGVAEALSRQRDALLKDVITPALAAMEGAPREDTWVQELVETLPPDGRG